MKDLVLAWLCFILYIGAQIWLAYDIIKNFGWQGLLVKYSVFINGMFLMFVILFHESPLTALRTQHVPAIGNASCQAFLAFWLVWLYFLIFDRPMRWLMKTPAKWLLPSGAAIWCVAFLAGLKGWI